MPNSPFRVLLNIPYIAAYCARKGWNKTDLCAAVQIDPKTLLPGLNEENPQEVTITTLTKLHATLGGDIALLSRDLLAKEAKELETDLVKRDLHFSVPIRPTAKNLALAEKLFKALAFARDASEDEIEFSGPALGSIILKCALWDPLIPRALARLNSASLDLRRGTKTPRRGRARQLQVDALIFPLATCVATPSKLAQFEIEHRSGDESFPTWETYIIFFAKWNVLRISRQDDGAIVVRRPSSSRSARLKPID